jgi:transposase-like protein
MESDNVVPMSRHFCPACGRPMRVVLVIPRFGSFPELQTYECRECGVSYTEAVKETNKETNKETDGCAPANADKLTPR